MSARVLLATGGTGGHVFPALALAAALEARGLEPLVLTDARGQGYLGDAVPSRVVRAAALSGGGLQACARGAGETLIGTWQAIRLMRSLRPQAVVGFGGYATVPTLLAAAHARLPIVLHEQNAVLGRANRGFAERAAVLAASFAETQGVPARAMATLRVTGNPVRASVLPLRALPYPASPQGGALHLLVFGGSQGARVLGDVVPAALARLPAAARARLRVTQQCRPEQMAAVGGAYAAAGIAASLAPFFDDLPARMAAAHLVVCRAGSSTIAELGVIGRPAILVPFPAAADDHQSANARAVERAGAGWLLPQESFSPPALAARIETFLEIPAMLAAAAARARALGRPEAALELASLVAAACRPANGGGQDVDRRAA